MIFVELHDKNGDPFKVNPAAILFYKPYGEHLSTLTMYYGLDSINVIVKESYEEVNRKMQHFEMVNDILIPGLIMKGNMFREDI